MEDIILKTASECKIHCGYGTFEKYAPQVAKGQCFVVTDSNLFALYRHILWRIFGYDNIVITAGENSKSLSCLKDIFNKMAECGMRRGCTVVAFGGGVVGDIAGLAASLYMRGVKLVQIPTSLLALVDSCVGGKTAINFANVKNLIGTFYQPEEVIADPCFLNTLPQREFRSGLGEIIKYCALDSEIFGLVKAAGDFNNFDFLAGIISRCLKYKANIVSADERDCNSVRKVLNLGHTTGHAFELYYRRRTHGEYVLIGMFYEMYIAEKLGIGNRTYFSDLRNIIFKVVKIPSFEDVREAAALAELDKKNTKGGICLVVPESEGKCAEITLSVDEYSSYLAECADSLKGGL